MAQLSALQTQHDHLQHQHHQLQLAHQLEVTHKKRGEEREKTYRVELSKRAEEVNRGRHHTSFTYIIHHTQSLGKWLEDALQ
ncbi:hypothetical protein EON63_15755 [archaeon]|nr:MAG: hypothetical protein EON63_15755 [archaeon]